MNFRIYVVNLGKFSDGDIGGEWVNLPISIDAFNEVLDRLGVSYTDSQGIYHESRYADEYTSYDFYSITQSENDFNYEVKEHHRFEQLNHVAELMTDMTDSDLAEFRSIMEVCDNDFDYATRVYVTGQYLFIRGARDVNQVGRYLVENGMTKLAIHQSLYDYIDYSKIVRDFHYEGKFTQEGFIELYA